MKLLFTAENVDEPEEENKIHCDLISQRWVLLRCWFIYFLAFFSVCLFYAHIYKIKIKMCMSFSIPQERLQMIMSFSFWGRHHDLALLPPLTCVPPVFKLVVPC